MKPKDPDRKGKKQAGQSGKARLWNKGKQQDGGQKGAAAAIRLIPDGKLTGRDKSRLAAAVRKAKRDGRIL